MCALGTAWKDEDGRGWMLDGDSDVVVRLSIPLRGGLCMVTSAHSHAWEWRLLVHLLILLFTVSSPIP
jgi:hypothetical protein